MSDEKPVREFERLVLRVPDKLRADLMQRAKASGRSANAEAVTILTAALGEPNELELRELREELRAVERQRHELLGNLEGIDRRMYALVDRIKDLQVALGVDVVVHEDDLENHLESASENTSGKS